jgi:AcrR family transcriptional regulator
MGLREQKEEHTRLQIIKVAFQLFCQQGIDATTLVDIAELCQLSRPTIYKYFTTKHALVQSVYIQNFQNLMPLIAEISPASSLTEVFQYVTQHFNRLLLDNPEVLVFDAQYNLYAALIHQDPTQYPQHIINSPDIQQLINVFIRKFSEAKISASGSAKEYVEGLFLTYFEHIQRMAIFWIQRGQKNKDILQTEFETYNNFFTHLILK